MTRLTRLAYAATAAAVWLVGVRHDAPFLVTCVTSVAAVMLAARALPGDRQVTS